LDQRHHGALEQLASPSCKLADAPLLSNRTGLLLALAVLDRDSAIGLVGDDYSSHHYNYTHCGIISDQLHEDWMLNLSATDRYGYEIIGAYQNQLNPQNFPAGQKLFTRGEEKVNPRWCQNSNDGRVN